MRGCTSDRGRLGHKVKPTLDQVMEYSSVIGGMCLGEIASSYDVIENRMLINVGGVRQSVDALDVRMEDVEESMRDFDMRVSEVEEHVGAAERTHDAFKAFVDGFDPRVHRLEREVRELQQQVGELLMFRAVLQHGPGNPVVIEDEEDEEDLEAPVFPLFMGGGVGGLVPIVDDEDDNEPAVEVVAQQIFDEGGPAPLYKLGEDVPAYEEAPEYQIPPIVKSSSCCSCCH